MPTVLETDDTKTWRIYKETGEVKQTFKNRGLGTIHSYMKAKQMIYAKNHPVANSSEIWNGSLEFMRLS